jgi:transcriptional regulator with XRE-family HTH domain
MADPLSSAPWSGGAGRLSMGARLRAKREQLGIGVRELARKIGISASFIYDASMPHRLWAIGDESVHAIWAVVGRRNDPRFESLRRDHSNGP